MQLTGTEQFSRSQAEIWQRLNDVEFLAHCLPDVEMIQKDEAGRLVCRVRPGFSFAKGTLQVMLDIFESQPPDTVRIRIHSKGIGSLAIVETVATLAEVDSGTQLSWSAEATELGGLLKPVSRGLISAAAQRVIAAGWSRFHAAIENVV